MVIKLEGYQSDQYPAVATATTTRDEWGWSSHTFRYDCRITKIRLADLQTAQPIKHFSQVAVAEGVEVSLTVVPKAEYYNQVIVSSSADTIKGKMMEIFSWVTSHLHRVL